MEYWILVPLGGMVVALAGMFYEYKKSTLKMNSKMEEIGDGVVQNELEQIKQRLTVLEKIITDKKYNLNDELSELTEG